MYRVGPGHSLSGTGGSRGGLLVQIPGLSHHLCELTSRHIAYNLIQQLHHVGLFTRGTNLPNEPIFCVTTMDLVDFKSTL